MMEIDHVGKEWNPWRWQSRGDLISSLLLAAAWTWSVLQLRALLIFCYVWYGLQIDRQ
jgi:hypothetical protein